MTPRLCQTLALAVLTAPAGAMGDAPQFAVTRIGETLAPLQVSFARGLNEDGDAVGEIWFSGFRQAFVYSYEHGPILLPFVVDHPNARAFDVSDRDADGLVVIVGVAADSFYDEVGIAVFWRYSTVSGEVLDAIEIGALPGFTQSVARAVNNQGLIVGYSGFTPMVYDVATGVLEPFDFPALPADINNVGQVVGGRYRGDLQGEWEDLGIPATASGMGLNAVNDLGWVVGTASMPYTDGAGHFVNGNAWFMTEWDLFYASSRFDSGVDLNGHGDVVGSMGISAAIRPVLIVESLDELFFINDLIAPEQPFFMESALAINDAGQIAGGNQAVLLTPLGVTIIPGDVDGDADVDLDDLCVWHVSPIDLDGDGDADDADGQWLVERLEALGFTIADCNGNGAADACDISDGASADCNENGVPDECEADCDGDGTPDDCEADCNGNGVPDPCDIADGFSDDCNGNGIPDECDGIDVFTHEDVFKPPVFLLQVDTFVDDLLVADAGTVADVDFTLDIDYRIGNLVVRLSHGGVTIVLLDRPGHPEGSVQGNGQLGYRITLDDEGAGGPIEDVGNFGSPFEPILSPPSYQPDEALSVFDGMPLGGTWTVEVTTSSFSPVSSFNAWGLVIEDEPVTVGPCCPADVDGTGAVDVEDLVAVILDWSTDGAGHDGDVDGSGLVDVEDLLAVITGWGPCS